MAKNKEFDEEKVYAGKFEEGKVYINLSQVAIVVCMGEYSMVTLRNGQDHKFKSEKLVILE